METLKKLSLLALKNTAFFAGITGCITVIILLSNTDALVNGLSIGKSMDIRISGILTDGSSMYYGFAIGYVITLALNMSIFVSRIATRINIEEYKDVAKTFAREQNRSLDKLGNRLCHLSVAISLMSVGVFLFHGITTAKFLLMVQTPIFWVQLLLFLSIALGVPSSISRLANYMSVKHAVILGKMIHKIEKSVEDYINDSLKDNEQEAGNELEEEEGISAKIKRLKKDRLKIA